MSELDAGRVSWEFAVESDYPMTSNADMEGFGKEKSGGQLEESRCVYWYHMSMGIASNGVCILALTTLSSHEKLNEDTCTLLHEIAKLEL